MVSSGRSFVSQTLATSFDSIVPTVLFVLTISLSNETFSPFSMAFLHFAINELSKAFSSP